MYVYLLFISLVKIVFIYKSIRIEISFEFYLLVILIIDMVIVNNYFIIYDF